MMTFGTKQYNMIKHTFESKDLPFMFRFFRNVVINSRGSSGLATNSSCSICCTRYKRMRFTVVVVRRLQALPQGAEIFPFLQHISRIPEELATAF